MTKTWFITGTSSGFGLRLTERALERGDRVAATLREPHRLEALKARYPDALFIGALDVTKSADVRRVLGDAFGTLGRIDVVVSNAGYGLFGAAEEVTDEQIRLQLDTNLVGSMNVVRAALPHLRAQGGGRILQISSAGGQTTYPGFSVYHATKWGIEGFVEAVAKEVASFGIDVTIVEPGATQTGFAEALAISPLGPAYEASVVGDVLRGFANGAFPIEGDVDKMVRAILASVDERPAPLRLALGKDTYADVRASLVARLHALDAQAALAQAMAK